MNCCVPRLSHRLDDTRIPKRVFYGQLHHGSRRPGGQYKWYKDCLKSTLNCCGIEPSELEALAMDRAEWHSSCKSAVEKFRNTTHSGVGVWSTIHPQLWVPDLPPDVSFTNQASSYPQQVPLVMMRPVALTAQSMTETKHTSMVVALCAHLPIGH